MEKSQKEELMYILEGRLGRYAAAAKEWLETTGPYIKGTFTDRISGDIPLYFKSNARKWQSIVPYVSPFCFCFTKDLGISSMLDENMRIEDMLEELSAEGWTINGLKVVAKSNTHLLGTSRQAIIMYPDNLDMDYEMGEVNVSLTLAEAAELADNKAVPRSVRNKVSRQMQGKKEFGI